MYDNGNYVAQPIDSVVLLLYNGVEIFVETSIKSFNFLLLECQHDEQCQLVHI